MIEFFGSAEFRPRGLPTPSLPFPSPGPSTQGRDPRQTGGGAARGALRAELVFRARGDRGPRDRRDERQGHQDRAAPEAHGGRAPDQNTLKDTKTYLKHSELG